MRFKQGEIEIRADEEWREAMAAPSRALVTSLSWPSLLRYGFV
jgi:hypothetical protein